MAKIYVVVKDTKYCTNLFVTAYLDLEKAKNYCDLCNSIVIEDKYYIKTIER